MNNKRDYKKDPSKGDNAIKGVKNYLLGQGIDETYILSTLADYSNNTNMNANWGITETCEEIQKDFGAFVKWFKEYQNRDI